MKKTTLAYLVLLALNLFAFGAAAQIAVPSAYKQISIDGSFADWSGVPLAYTAAQGSTNAIQYENVYIANDSSNLYLRVTLYAPRPTAFQNTYDNIFIDTDNNSGTGFYVGGIGSEMLVQWGGGYQETNNGFNVGTVNDLGWSVAGSPDNLDFELSLSFGATYAANDALVFASNTIAILLEGDSSSYVNTEFAPPTGGLVYTLAAAPSAATGNENLLGLSTSSWQVNDAGTDLGTNWLGAGYDDTGAGWKSGDGLFGYTATPGIYPQIQTTLSTSPNTYYFRTPFVWTNDTANVAFVLSNYLSDGAVYYLNGVEVRRIRMPDGAISYATAATSANPAPGAAEVFGIDASLLQIGTNILEVEEHQAAGSSADLVFGLSLTGAISYPAFIVNSNLPSDQTILAGQPVTFSSDAIGSGPLSYQWFFGTNPISGATEPTYTIPSVLTNNAGAYSLQISNALATVTTRSATLTVSSTPVAITSNPSSQIAVEGKSVTFTVGVTGTPLITYQWLLNSQPINNATNATYTIPAVAAGDAGSYSVILGNPAGTTNSSPATLSVILDTIAPTISALSGGYTTVTVTFSKAVDAITASDPSKYSLSGGVSVIAASQNPGNPAQITLTTGAPLAFGTVYTLTATGVKSLFGVPSSVSAQFARGITIDGSFDDWNGLTPLYSTTSPSGNTNAADFEDIYVYNDANFYYFRVTLWTDIEPSAGQFPAYVNMFYDTDNNAGTGYSAFGSDLLVQSGYAYQEKDGTFNDGFPINNLDWLCLPASPGTNFEFEMSRGATFSEDNSAVFSTNQINFVFQGMTPGFVLENTAPANGVLSYVNVTPVTVAPLPVSDVSLSLVANGQAAVSWDGTATLQQSSSVTGPWTNVPGAVAPYIIPSGSGSQFYRLTR